MSKRTYGHVLVLPSRLLVRPATDDEFVTKILKVKICFFLKKRKKKYICAQFTQLIFFFLAVWAYVIVLTLMYD